MKSIEGVDFSRYQLEVNLQIFDKDFLIAKSSEGYYIDPYYPRNQRKLLNQNKPWGTYHYFHPDVDAVFQAETAVLLAEKNKIKLSVDVEAQNGVSPNKFADALLKFLKTVESYVYYKPIIYTRKGFWDQYLPKVDWAKEYPLWVANYGVILPAIPRDWDTYAIHQYTERGKAQGFNTNVDLNVYNGDWNKFNQELLIKPGNVYIPPQEEAKKGRVLVNNLRIRTQPSTTSTVVNKLYIGNVVTILEEKNIGKDIWVRIGKDQWTAKKYNNYIYIENI